MVRTVMHRTTDEEIHMQPEKALKIGNGRLPQIIETSKNGVHEGEDDSSKKVNILSRDIIIVATTKRIETIVVHSR